MFKLFRRVIGHIVGAFIVGPIAGLLGGLIYDSSNIIKVNMVTVASVLIAAAGFLFGLPALFLAVGIGCLLFGNYFLDRERKDSNRNGFDRWYNSEHRARLKAGKKIDKKDMDDKLNEAFTGGQFVHTPWHSGFIIGFTVANMVKSVIAGGDPNTPEARVYNLQSAITPWFSTRGTLLGADGFDVLQIMNAPNPDAGPADALTAGGGADAPRVAAP
jgi:hypothetical protein